MGSIIMEPDDIFMYAEESGMPGPNLTICTPVRKINSRGFFVDKNILDYSVPLLLLQLSLAAGLVLLISRLLKPLRQPLLVAQLFGGIMLGPSFLGRIQSLSRLIFPLRGFVLLDVLSEFGYIFYFFIIGVQTDPWIIKKINRKTFAIGFSTVAAPILLSTASSLLLWRSVSTKIAPSLNAVAQAESALSFPMIAYFLAELKIINTEFGRVALSATVISSLCSFTMITTAVLIYSNSGNVYYIGQQVAYFVSFTVGIIFFIRPFILWIIRHNPVGEPLKERYVLVLFFAVLLSAFCSHVLGLSIIVGPFILGLAIPAGPPIGSSMLDKLDLFTYWVFLPLHFVKSGLVIDIFAPSFKNYLAVQFIAVMGATGKFLGAFLTSIYCQLPARDAVLLGLVMNAQGVLEVGMFKMMRKSKAIDYESFVCMNISTLLVNGIITPLIRYLYDPSRRYMVYGRRTVMHSSDNSELRVLVCLHDQEDTPTAINLLEAFNPTKRSPLAIYMLHLTELVGRANPLLIPHCPNTKLPSAAIASGYIVNAFRQFEQSNYGTVLVYPFTVISPEKTMHDDVCSVALDKKITLIMIPFYKKFHADGKTQSCLKVIKNMNSNVLNKAPCSIAIFVDRGLLKSSRSILASWSSYRVAVLFLGGDDDREALALAARMAGHLNIYLTVIRLLENGNIIDTKESRLDDDMVDEFKSRMEENCRVLYVEEVVADAAGTVAVIRAMENRYELVVVGRRHDNQSLLVSGLIDWDEQTELGAVGDVLASEEFMGKTTILVVQQHVNVGDENHGNHKEYIRGNSMLEDEGEEISIWRSG